MSVKYNPRVAKVIADLSVEQDQLKNQLESIHRIRQAEQDQIITLIEKRLPHLANNKPLFNDLIKSIKEGTK